MSATSVNGTSAGIRDLLGGGVLGGLGLIAIWIGTVAVNAMNDYSGSLALQAAGVPVRRPVVAVIVTVAAFFLTLWLNTGTLATKFENVLLFITYWVPPFAAIQMVDWWRKRGKMNVQEVLSASLKPGWEALVALLVGFAAATPFMETSLFVGYASSHWLQGGDIAFVVGFVVALVVYAGSGGSRPAACVMSRPNLTGRRRWLARRPAGANGRPR